MSIQLFCRKDMSIGGPRGDEGKMIAYPSRRMCRGLLAPESDAPNLRPAVRPVVLVILDGFGCREPTPDNAIAQARSSRTGTG